MNLPKMSVRLAAILPLFLPAGGCICTVAVLGAGRRQEQPAVVGDARTPVIAARADRARGRLAIHYRTGTEKPPLLMMGYIPAERFFQKRPLTPGERWLNLDLREVRRALAASEGVNSPKEPAVSVRRENGRNIVWLAHEFVAERTASRCRWPVRKMEPLEVRETDGNAPAPAGACVAVAKRPPEAPPGGPAPEPNDDFDSDPAWAQAETVRICVDFPETDGPDELVFYLPSRRYRTAGGWAAQLLLPAAMVADILIAPVLILDSAGR